MQTMQILRPSTIHTHGIGELMPSFLYANFERKTCGQGEFEYFFDTLQQRNR